MFLRLLQMILYDGIVVYFIRAIHFCISYDSEKDFKETLIGFSDLFLYF